MPEFVMEPESAGFAKIKVLGVGGGGCNAVDWMFDTGLQNVEFYCLNTDAQALKRYKCPNKIQIGTDTTRGRGCGGSPEMGGRCMEEARESLEEILQGADIVFVTAGLGGGTGTGGAPIVASVARSLGILTVAVVSRPFRFEGPRRMTIADKGLEKLRTDCDTIITISNDRLLEVAGQKTTLREAFAIANNVLSQAVQSISDLVTIPGLINVDFNDIRTVMGDRGGAVMGIGIGKGENRASEAVKKATSSPLLDKIVIDGATGVLVSITGGPDMTLSHVNEAMSQIHECVDTNAEIIFGAVVDESVNDQMRVIIIATGFPDDPHKLMRDETHKAETVAAAATMPFMTPPRPVMTQPQAYAPTAQASQPGNGGAQPRQAQPQARPPMQPVASAPNTRGQLRQEINDIREEETRPAYPARPAQPAMPARPSPAPQPRTGGNGEAGFGAPSQPEYNALRDNQDKPNIPVYNPGQPQQEAEVESTAVKTDDYEIPAFLRRRRSALFD